MSTLSVTIIQSDLHWENRPANLEMFEEKINSIRERTEVVVLPEMFSTGFSMQPERLAETMEGETVQWMKRVAAEKKVIITGSIIIGDKDPGDRDGNTHYYNRLIWMLPNGQYGVYDKRHRFAYAGEDDEFSPGTKRLIASVKGWKINLLICYDLRFPVWARQNPATVVQGSGDGDKMGLEYDALIYVANWPEKRVHAWKTLLQARAIENQCYVIGVNRVGDDGNKIHYTGESMVVDPLGEVLYTKKEDEAIHTIILHKDHLNSIREKLPFWKDADHFQIIDGGEND